MTFYVSYTIICVVNSENTSLQTQTSVEYYESDAEHIYGAIKKETDVLGNETKYFRNPQNGRTEAVIGPNGKGTTYTYDGMGRTETVLPATYNGTAYTGVSGSSKVQYGYDSAGRLSTITTRETAEIGTTYNFSYDVFGNGTGVSIGTRELASYTYNTRNGKLNTLAYGNGLNVRYVYDEYERISEIRYRNGDSGNFTTRYRYTYDSSGNLYSIEDIANHEITVNDYDSFGTLRSTVTYSSTDYYNRYGSHYYYDDESRISEIQESFDYSVGAGHSDGGNCYLFDYTDEGTLDKLKIYDYNYSVESRPQYDNLGRVDTKTVTAGRSNSAHHFYNSLSFGYVSTEEYCTGRINQFRSTVKVSPESAAVSDTTYRYTYDQNGNITEIRTAGNVIEYKYCYDELGQLIREDNRPLGKTYKYTYDLNGNRKKKETYDFTLGTPGELRDRVDYTYGDPAWHDLLTKIGTSTIVQYDTVGNPVRIGDSTLTWEGRALRTRYDGQYQYLSYRYNSDGIRVFKEEYAEEPGYTVRHEYTVSGSRIIKETVYYDGSEIYTLVFSYDENGAPIGYRFRKPNYPESVYDYYYYDKNLQGDIIAVYGSHGDLLVSYIYDAWGKSFAEYSNESEDEYYNNSGEYFNPFRYRGYYYDEETGLYYLNSRYYDPEVGRFISPDTTDVLTATPGALTDKNLYAYCDNTPVMREDKGGQFWNIIAGAAVGAFSQYVFDVIGNIAEGKTGAAIFAFKSSVVDYLAATASGALAATGISALGAIAANASISGAAYLINSEIDGEDATKWGFIEAFVGGGISGAIGGSGTSAKTVNGIRDTAAHILKTAVSPKKIAMYTGKIAATKTAVKKAIGRTVASVVVPQVVRIGYKAIVR